MTLNSMQELFTEQVADLYSAEHQLVEAPPKMARAATDRELKSAFEHHLEETRGHVRRLEQIFEQVGVRQMRRRARLIKEDGSPAVKDAALIAAAQRVEHYEIAGYGTVRAFADVMDMGDVRDLLDQALEEEGSADKKLTDIATGGLLESGINEDALSRRYPFPRRIPIPAPFSNERPDDSGRSLLYPFQAGLRSY